ncbi:MULTISPECIES: YeaC family protein [unclassified Pseudoalteromonas]|jgi:uncharacterized protein YeaC (DUF1315 family)|uniref:YeaC family protein n=1 Tax=unclassified Pseudoalteromonas TaxID=194690 RepID=UPI0005A7C433|nr:MULTISPECIES: DUF1315 family protein [unclassified Pseudoalteromonas]MBU2968630.1 DUF1315 family protein [Pseudoalteromonas sp. C2R02]
MNLEHLISNITPELFERLKYGAATGRWPDGVALSDAQKEQTVQLVMLYQAKVEQSNEQFTISSDGEMVMKSKRELKSQFAEQKEIARFNENDI